MNKVLDINNTHFHISVRFFLYVKRSLITFPVRPGAQGDRNLSQVKRERERETRRLIQGKTPLDVMQNGYCFRRALKDLFYELYVI